MQHPLHENSACGSIVSLLPLILASLSATATPPEKATDQDSLLLTPVVVTAERQERPVAETGRSINLVTEDRLKELQARSVPEALDYETGIHMQTTNRGAGAPIIRGFVGPQNLLLIDGVRFTSSTHRTGPNQYLALFDPNSISRIEVVRGASSVMYGNGALGGVINILTDSPLKSADEFDYQGRVRGRFSSADLSSGATLMFTGAAEDFGFLIGGTYDYFGELRVGDGTTWPLSDYQTGYWRAKLVYSPDNYTVSLGYFGMLMRNAGRTDGLGKGETRLYDNDDHLVYARFEWTGDLVEYVRVTASYQRLDEDVARYNCSTNGGVVSNRTACATQDLNIIQKQRRNFDATNTIGSEAEIGLAFWNNRIHVRAGVDAYYDVVESTREDAKTPDFEWAPRDRGNFSDGSTYLTLGAFTHADAVVMDVTEHHLQLRLSGGVRYAHFSAAAPDVAGLGDIDYAFNGIVGSAGMELILPQKLTLYTSFMQGFRAPNLQETTVLGDTGSTFEVPNLDLGPERTDTIEAGIKLQLGPVQMSAAYFYSILSDAIGSDLTTWRGQAVIDNKQVAHRVNNESGESQGIEWDMSLTLGRWLIAGGVAWISSQHTKANGTQINARRIPPVTGNARVRYTGSENRWYLEFGTRFAAAQTKLSPGDLRDARICEEARHSGTLQTPCDGTPAFFVADLRAGHRFTSNLRIDLALANLFDSLYRRHGSGFDAPGIDARLSLTTDF